MAVSRDLTTGSVASKLIPFAVPILLSNMLQALYNIVDMIIVGQYVGSSGMSAISIGGQLTHMVLVVVIGLSNGGSVVIGRMFGRGETGEMRRTVSSMVCFLTIVGVAVAAAMIACARPLLRLMDTPAASFEQTVTYLTICMSGTVFIYIYNALNAALRGIGQSMRPMIIVTVTTVLNVALDFVFVGLLGMDVAGAALATVICQLISAVMIVWYCCRSTELMTLNRGFFRIHLPDLSNMVRIGLPQSIQFTATNISFLLVLSLINSYNVVASAAAGAANKVWSFGMLPGQSMMSAMVSLTAQNLPKKNYGRIYRGFAMSVAISWGIGFVMIALCWLIPDQIYSLFTSEEAVGEMGRLFLGLYSLCFITENYMFCQYGILTGAGYTTITMTCAILSAFVARYTLAVIFSQYTALGFDGIALAYPLSPLISITISGIYLLSGRWKISRIDRLEQKRAAKA
ncbi:MAG: MATE family efflux transporter [Oscillospiraceae bacterium]|nr:MATE family efflux transporter [Oscillospiraceae bacterium]